MLVWTHYCDSLAAQEHFLYEMRMSHNPHAGFQWFFGDLPYRLNPAYWIKAGWRALHGTLGSLPFLALATAAFLGKASRLARLWLLAAFLTTLVFTHLVLEHWHYYLMCCPDAVPLLVQRIAHGAESQLQPTGIRDFARHS